MNRNVQISQYRKISERRVEPLSHNNHTMMINNYNQNAVMRTLLQSWAFMVLTKITAGVSRTCVRKYVVPNGQDRA